MSRFAVAQSYCFENDLTIEIIEADNLKAAIMGHSAFNKRFEDMPDDLDEIKEFFVARDILVSVIEIT